jgi:hypothetical protein
MQTAVGYSDCRLKECSMPYPRPRARSLYEVFAVAGIFLATAGIAVMICVPRGRGGLYFGKFNGRAELQQDDDGDLIVCPIQIPGAPHRDDWELIVETGDSRGVEPVQEIVHITSDRKCTVVTSDAYASRTQLRQCSISEDSAACIQSFVESWPATGVHRSFDNDHFTHGGSWLTVRVRVSDQLWVFTTDSTVTRDLIYFLSWLDDEVVEPARRLPSTVATSTDVHRLKQFGSMWDLASWIPRKDVSSELVELLLSDPGDPIEYLELHCTAVTDLSFLSHPRCAELQTLDLTSTESADLSTLPEEVCQRLDSLLIVGTGTTTEALQANWDKLRHIRRIEAVVDLPAAVVESDPESQLQSLVRVSQSVYQWLTE